jgi:hypothetical protein
MNARESVCCLLVLDSVSIMHAALHQQLLSTITHVGPARAKASSASTVTLFTDFSSKPRLSPSPHPPPALRCHHHLPDQSPNR